MWFADTFVLCNGGKLNVEIRLEIFELTLELLVLKIWHGYSTFLLIKTLECF